MRCRRRSWRDRCRKAALGRRARSEDARIGAQNFAIEFFELKIAGNVGAKRADGVRESGGAKAGMKFLGDRAAADHFAAFENERLEAAFGEIKRGDECVVAAADDNYALSDGHGQFLLPFEREASVFFHSFKMTWLAMRPGAPMMPPPGCVAEPHI